VTEEGPAEPSRPTFSITDLTKPAGVVAPITRLFERQGRFLRDTINGDDAAAVERTQ